jgi:hypothetical protein
VLEELPDHARPQQNDSTMMTNRRQALASGLRTLSPRADAATHQPVTTTLSTAVSAVRYPSSPSVALNRPAVTIQRVAQHTIVAPATATDAICRVSSVGSISTSMQTASANPPTMAPTRIAACFHESFDGPRLLVVPSQGLGK